MKSALCHTISQCSEFGCFLTWKMCSLSEKMCSDVFLIWKIFTYFRSWFSNAYQSVHELCNMERGQIINDICDNNICQNYYVHKKVGEVAKLPFVFMI